MERENKFIYKFIWNIFKKYKWNFVFAFLSYAICERCAEVIILPSILRIFGNNYANGTLTALKVIILAFIYAFVFGTRYLSDSIFWKTTIYNSYVKFENDLRQQLFKYTLKHSQSYFADNMSGNLTNEIDTITSKCEAVIENFFIASSCSIIFIILIFIYINISIKITIFLCCWAIAFFTFNYFASKAMYKSNKNISQENNIISGLITDDLLNISTIKSYSKQNREKHLIKKQGIKILQKESDNLWVSTYIGIGMFILTMSLICPILIIAVKMLIDKQILIGTFLFIIQNVILTSFLASKMFKSFSKFIEYFSQIKNCLNNLMTKIEIENKTSNKINISQGKIEFKNINFKY